MTDNTIELKQEIKRLIVDNLMLHITVEEIPDEAPLFGPGGLGLDSIDALQLVVALDRSYGLKITTPDVARDILQSVTTISAAVARHQTTQQTVRDPLECEAAPNP